MVYLLADIDKETSLLLSLWASTCGISIPHLFGVAIERSVCPVEIYRSGVLVARSSTYQGV